MSDKDDPIQRITALLNRVPQNIIDGINKRRQAWTKRHTTIFKDASTRYDSIRSCMVDGSKFSALNLEAITEDLAFLAAFYAHMVEFEGQAIARKAIYERCFRDNIFFLKAGGIIKGRSFEECKADAYQSGFASVFEPLEKEIASAELEINMSGVADENRRNKTSRADAIKMLIEVFKKRHDAKLRERNVEGGGRTS